MKKTNYFFFSSFVKQISYYILPVLALLLWQPGFSQQGILSIDGNASINIPAGTCMGSSQGVVNITFQNVSFQSTAALLITMVPLSARVPGPTIQLPLLAGLLPPAPAL